MITNINLTFIYKIGFGLDYDIGFGSSRSFMLDLDVKHLDKVITMLMKNRIQVKEV